MDDVGIWNRALSPSEIQAICDGGMGALLPTIVRYHGALARSLTFAVAPYAAGNASIAMVASTASDASGVEYFFANTAGDGHSSGWQTSPNYTDTGLSAGTYTYMVRVRDKSFNRNKTTASSPASATISPARDLLPQFLRNVPGHVCLGYAAQQCAGERQRLFCCRQYDHRPHALRHDGFHRDGHQRHTPTQISAQVITKSSQASTTQTIYLWNYITSAWDQKTPSRSARPRSRDRSPSPWALRTTSAATR